MTLRPWLSRLTELFSTHPATERRILRSGRAGRSGVRGASVESLELRQLLTADLAENNAALWAVSTTDGQPASITNSSLHVHAGASSIQVQSSGVAVTASFPASGSANWQLSDAHHMEFRMQLQNPGTAWQARPRIQLLTAGGGIAQYESTIDPRHGFFPLNGDFFATVPLHGDATWSRTDIGIPRLDQVNQVRFSLNSAQAGFTAWIDGLRFFEPVGYEVQDAAATDDNLIRNPSFELPASGATLPDELQQIQVLYPGANAIAGWEIFPGDASGTVDWVHEAVLDGAQGRLSIDLNGTPGFGGIRQRVPTMPGVRYDLQFELGGNPAGAFLPVPDDRLKVMEVRAAGQSQVFEHLMSTTPQATNPEWRTRTWSFLATDYETLLEFRGLSPAGSLFGAMVDNVHLAPSRNLIQNGSFENFAAMDPAVQERPDRVSRFLTLRENSRAIDGWEVIVFNPGSTIDWVHEVTWRASEGELSLDLNGTPGRGGVRQTISTEPGRVYELNFDLAGNPLVGAFDPVKIMRLSIDEQSQDFSFTVDPQTGLHEPHWQTKTVRFTATDSSTTIEFLSLAPTLQNGSDTLGPIIDNVRVELAQNLVINGGFETAGNLSQSRSLATGLPVTEPPSVIDPTQSVNANAVFGWEAGSISGGGGGVAFLPLWNHVSSTRPSEGHRSVYLAGASRIQQVVPTTIGRNYLISFDLGGAPTGVGAGVDDSVALQVGSFQTAVRNYPGLLQSSSRPGWVHHEFVVTADSASSLLQFRTFSGNPLIDNVSVVSLDFGDAGGTFPTSFAQNGARHLPQGPILGGRRDSEPDALSNDGVDEDGVLLTPMAAGTVTPLTVVVTNPSPGSYTQASSVGTYLSGWIDFNNDGDWTDPGEQIADDMIVLGGRNTISVSVPATIEATTARARFRVSTQAGLEPTGEAPDGEVEDYVIPLVPPSRIEGVVWNDINGNAIRDIVTITGSQPDVVFIVDVSGSTTSAFSGSNSVGDQNADGQSNTILDAEIAAFIALNQHLIDRGFGTTADVILVPFASSASAVDMNPVLAGIQTSTFPAADLNSNGQLDVVESLRRLTSGGGTEFGAALDAAAEQLNIRNTRPVDGNVIFLSDGQPSSGNYGQSVANVRQRAANVRAFGVGTGSSLPALQVIDSGAAQFLSPGELVNAFSGVGGGTAFLEPGLPGWTVYLDVNNNGLFDSGEPSTLSTDDNITTTENESGRYSFRGLPAGSYTVRHVTQSGWRRTFPISPVDSHDVTTTPGQTVSNLSFGDQLNTSPDAVNDQYTLTVNGTQVLNLLSNDSDPDGDLLSILSTTQPSHGSIRMVGGQLVYEPDLNYAGNDSFQYTITDGNGGTDTATVALTISGTSVATVLNVTTTADSGPGSLRQAILDANAATTDAIIRFEIPSTDSGLIDVDSLLAGGDLANDVFRIVPASSQPEVRNTAGNSIVIDAVSQALFTGETNVFGPEIVLDGISAGNASGFSLRGPAEIRGFSIQNFALHGISAVGNDIVVAGNYIGLDATGTQLRSNLQRGVEVASSQRVLIGGPDAADRNVISGNSQEGIFVHSGTSGLEVANNFLGTNAAGTATMGAQGTGVRLENSSSISIHDNLLSGHTFAGLTASSINTLTIQKNRIGTSADGKSVVPNGVHGIELVGGTNILVGGPLAGHGNLVSGQSQVGLRFLGNHDGLTIENNRVGTSLAGDVDLGNGIGISVTATGSRAVRVRNNLVSGNSEYGIGIFGNPLEPVLVEENRVGVNASGTAVLGNGGNGVRIQDASSTVVKNNVVAGNSDGIEITRAHNITVAGNSIGILADGQTAAGNISAGIAVEQSQNITIGGLTPADRNVISGNGSAIRLSQTHTASITNNYIGTDITGNLPVPNGRDGHHSTAVQIVDSSNVIFGAPGAGNLVSASVGSFARGVELLNSQQITVQANRIGTNAAGNLDLGNDHSGLYLRDTTDVLIGGIAPNEGNVISGNARSGIELVATSNITIQANRIGTSADGMLAIPNFDGISITNSSDVQIGGSTAAAGNLISANHEDGIDLYGFLHNSNQSNQIIIRNNLIGTDSTGNGLLGNGRQGIRVTRTDHIQISDNVISDSGNDGIRLEGHSEDFQVFEWPVSAGGNGHFYTLIRPMSWSDAEAAAAGIGGHLASITSAEESAFIASVFRSSTFAHRGDRLFIGLSDTAAEGTFSWATEEPLNFSNWSVNEPNGGVNENHAELLTDNTWNDTNGDLNHLYGLVEFTFAPDSALLTALQNPGTITQRITGNKIGVAADGTTLSGNASDGIEIVFGSARRDVVIGGNLPDESNIIAGNSQDGISINNTASGAVVSVTGNSIYSNGDLGIDLGSNGVTSNDAGDADTGANGLQNFPVLSIDSSVGVSRIVGTLDSTPDTTFSIEVFLNDVTTAAAAEGRTRVFTTTVTTDSSGQAQFVVPRQPLGTTGFLTATATRSTGETSEFSPAVPVLAEGPGVVLESDGQLVDLASLFSFGATQTGTSRSRTFVVRNTGTANLILQPATAPAGFSVTSNFGVNQIVPAGGTVSLVVRFDAITNGSSVRTLTINNNVSAVSLNIGATADHRLSLLADFVPGPGSSTPRQFARIGNQLIFRTFRDDVGIELFRTDGTTAGTTLLADINPGTAASTPSGMHSNGTLAAFRANDGTHGNELWVTDGTPGGTRMTSDLNPGAASGATSQIFVASDGSVYFTGDDGTTGLELWRYNSATGTTSLVSDIVPGSEESFPSDFVEYNGRLYFNASDGPTNSELWVTDGTSAGTGRVIDLVPGPEGSYAYPLGVANGVLFFVAEDASHGGELWSTDGTTAGTRLVKDIRPGASGSFPDFIGVLGSRIFFAGDDGMQGAELWSSDGTESGTVLVKDINSGAEDGPSIGGVATIGNRLYFHATTSGAGTEIWSTDGTSAGTTQLLDLFPGTTGLANSVFSLAALGSQLFFGGSDGTTGQELWVLNVNQTPAAPEIEVALNGANIQDNTGRAEYGIVPVGSTPVSQTFTVRNTGQSVLTLGTVTVPAGFQIINPLVTSLAPGASDTLVIRMNTTTTGLKTGVVTFSTNDGDENPFNFAVSGTISSLNLPPVIGSFDTPVSYTENGVPVVMDTNATVIDADSLNLATGRLIVTVAENMQLTDRAGIRHQGTGAGQIGVSALNVTYGGVLIGTFAGTTTLTVTLNDAATPVAVQALLRNITFSSLSENPSTLPRTVRVTLTDGDGGTSLPVTKTVNVVAANDAPVVSGVTGSVSYTENAVSALITGSALISDIDSANLQNGRLTVSLVTNAQSMDRIGIRHQGVGAGQIGVSGVNVTYSGVLIGTFSGTTTLTVILNDAATPAVVQALLRNVTFSSLSENPSILPRTVRVTLTDGDGGTSLPVTKTVNVVAANDAPVVSGVTGSVSYTENAVPTLIAAAAVVTDVDSANLQNGRLTVSLVTNAQSTDRIGIRHQGVGAGQIGVSGLSVSYGGVLIGTFAGTTTLSVTLNDKATPMAVQALLRNITFSSLSDNPSTLPRTVRITLTDGDGGTSLAASRTINVVSVNDAPVIGSWDTTTTYTENQLPVVLDLNVTVSDPDSLNLSAGKLIVSVVTNVQLTDRIGIRHQGTGVGQIGVSGLNVSFGGVVIGTFASTTTLTVTMNDAATPLAVQALVRNITFSSLSENPSALPRTVRVTLTDGDGGTSLSVTKTVNVIPVNDAPVIGPLAVGQTFVPGGSAVSFAVAATVADVDSANFDTGRLTVRIASNAQASDLLSITHQGTTAGKIGLTSSFGITFGGTLIGTYSGGAGTTALVVNFNSTATPSAVQALIRSLTYRSTLSTASTASRTISLSMTDGDGGTSSLVTTTLNVATPAARIAAAPPSSAIDRLFGSTSLSDELLAI